MHYYLENGDLFAPEGNVIHRYGEILISNYLKLLTGRDVMTETGEEALTQMGVNIYEKR
ncbi:MAG TPA: hypothetical protein VM577_10880 [Anaerovoracaceae bacterium]|nr:hypothetical protein [Anaerovoracaceae bacterium]